MALRGDVLRFPLDAALAGAAEEEVGAGALSAPRVAIEERRRNGRQ